MKVLALSLFLSCALSQSTGSIQADTAQVSANGQIDEAASASAQPTSMPTTAMSKYNPAEEPLFNLDLAPYNVALDVVGSALERLADVAEPIDLPLPLVGPGYYLEVQVKSPKNKKGTSKGPHSISIEGGFAPPVTEIDVILPGDSVAHQTILISASTQSASVDGFSLPTAMPTSHIQAPAPEPRPEPATFAESATFEVPAISTASTASSAKPTSTPSSYIDITEASGGASAKFSPPLPYPSELPNLPVSEEPEETSKNGFPSKSESMSAELPERSSSDELNTAYLPLFSATPSWPDRASVGSALGGLDMSHMSSNAVSSVTGSPGGIFGQFAKSSAVSDSQPGPMAVGMSGTALNLQPTESVSAPSSSALGAASSNPLLTFGALADSSSAASAAPSSPMDGMGLMHTAPANSVLLPSTSSSGFMSSPSGGMGEMASSPAPGLPKQVSDGMPSMSPAQPADATSPEPRAVPSRGVFGIFGGFGTSAAQSAPPGFSTGGPQMQSNMIMQTQTADLSAVSSAAPSASSHTLLSSSIGIEGPPLPFPSFTASSAEAPAAAAASEPSVSKGEGVRTVDIVSASDEKALESSIGAVIHSVLDDYKTVSVPKAAVGFALIRPRREFDMPERQPG